MVCGQDMSGEYYGIPGWWWFEKDLTPAEFLYRTTCRIELRRPYRGRGWNWKAYLRVRAHARYLETRGSSETLLEAVESIDPYLDQRTVVLAIQEYMRSRRCTLMDAVTGEELFGVYELEPSTQVPYGVYHYLFLATGSRGEFSRFPGGCSTASLPKCETGDR
jgi:hypothetical protein